MYKCELVHLFHKNRILLKTVIKNTMYNEFKTAAFHSLHVLASHTRNNNVRGKRRPVHCKNIRIYTNIL